jgi:hypothetical protein
MMTDAQRAQTTPSSDTADPRLLDPRVRPWMDEHLAEMRRSVAEHRFRSQILWTGFVGGLAAHIAGYLLRASAPTELLGLLADLLYTLGFALWTGVVVVMMVEIIPKAKERQILRALDAYEAAVRAGSQTAGKTPSTTGESTAT